MTRDELADAFAINIRELHAQVDALPDDATRRRARLQVHILHRAADELRTLAVTTGLIQPLSGGEPKPSEGP